MARIRSDKPEAYQSETLAEISLAAERTFKGMATIADDRGRLADKPPQINGELWSMRGNHSCEDLEAELCEMASVSDPLPLVCRYIGCDGKRYLHLPTWDRHQKIDRPSKSRLPRCPRHQAAPDYCGKHEGDCKPIDTWTLDASSRDSREPSRDLQPSVNGLDAVAALAGSLIEGEPNTAGPRQEQADEQHGSRSPDQEEQKSSRDSREPSRESPPLDRGSRTVDRGSRNVSAVAAQVPPNKRGTRIPDDFAENITPEMVAWAKDRCPHVDGKLETEKFVNYWQAKAGRDACKLDWVKTWKNRMLDVEQQTPQGRGAQNGNGPRPSTTDQRVAQAQALKDQLKGEA